MKLVVGLGNPGVEYRKTRHNIGFDVVDELARRHASTTPHRRFDGDVVEIFIGSEKVLLLAPLTYMNLSGRSVGAAVDFYKLALEDVLIVCDDMNLESGRLRFRAEGSAGGQNGLKDIFRRLGSEAVPRLRVGIGRPPGRMQPTDYVLGKIGEAERADLDEAVVRAADGVEIWMQDGIQTAMNVVNGRPAES